MLTLFLNKPTFGRSRSENSSGPLPKAFQAKELKPTKKSGTAQHLELSEANPPCSGSG